MSSAGHVLDMIVRMKNNKSLNDLRKIRHSRIRKAYERQIGKTKTKIHQLDLSDHDLRELKHQIRTSIRNERIFKIFITSFLTIISLGLIVIILVNFQGIINFIQEINNF